jgi:hypothetical protein
MEFLHDKDGVMSLKTLEEAKALGGTKRSLSMALSEFVRWAWSEYDHGALYFLYLTLTSKDNQAEETKLPGQTLGTNQRNCSIPNFSWISHSSTLIGCS